MTGRILLTLPGQ